LLPPLIVQDFAHRLVVPGRYQDVGRVRPRIDDPRGISFDKARVSCWTSVSSMGIGVTRKTDLGSPPLSSIPGRKTNQSAKRTADLTIVTRVSAQ
jgi:hypothetical protein